MKYKQLGNSEIQVSELCLGTMTWGHQNTEEDAHQQLDYAIAHGINFIDTAEMYAVPPRPETCHLTEQFLGSWLKKVPHREKLIIATKLSGPGMQWIRDGEGLTPDGLIKALDGSLKRLNTDYIDLYQLHWPQRKVNSFGRRDFLTEHADGQDHILEMMQALQKQIEAGKIREVGVSNETPWGLMKYLQHYKDDANLPRIQSTQNPYSLLQREFDNHTSEVCFRENIGMLPYSALAGGLLTGKYLDGSATPDSRFLGWGGNRQPGLLKAMNSEALKSYIELAHEHQLNPAQMALSFVTNRFFVTSTIIGATSMEQLKICVESADVQLSPDVIQKIEEIHASFPSPALI